MPSSKSGTIAASMAALLIWVILGALLMKEKNIWEIKNVWEVLSSVSTFLAIVVALYLASFQKRKDIKVNLSNEGCYSERFEVFVHIINNGNVSVVINSLYLIEVNGEIHEISKNIDENLPESLNPGQILKLHSPYLSHNFDKVKKVYIKDSTGKKWNCDRNSMRFCKTIKSKFIGKYGAFYSNENEKK